MNQQADVKRGGVTVPNLNIISTHKAQAQAQAQAQAHHKNKLHTQLELTKYSTNTYIDQT